ncbi:MAG: orotidine-5'-phosphate decarboxylase [Leptospirales bacterium]
MTMGPVDHLRRSLANPVCLALDVPDWERARTILDLLEPRPGMVKIGPVLYMREGRRVSEWLEKANRHVFLDFKWHDIPHTVGEAIAGIPGHAVRLITVHAQGGARMIAAARDAAERKSPDRPLVVAVTLLTHLDSTELEKLGVGNRWNEVKKLGSVALASGADGLVMAPGDLPQAREEWGPAPFLVTPGIRFETSVSARPSTEDQVLAETPGTALKKGSDLLVVGRPILESPQPSMVLEALIRISRSF